MDFNFDFDLDFKMEKENEDYFDLPSNFIKRDIPERSKYVMFKNAKLLAENIGDIKKNERISVITPGSFIFGDFLEAWLYKLDVLVDDLTLSTLSMSQENIDSLNNLLIGDYVNFINVLISDSFFSHERKGLIPYFYDELDNDKIQLSVTRCHTKITLLKFNDGRKVVISGSGNMKSSDNIENFDIEENEELYNFHKNWHDKIINKYQTLKKQTYGKKLWNEIKDE